MKFTKRLVMNFETVGGRKTSISIDDPRDDLDEAEIKSAMTDILSKGVFAPNGEPLAALVGAKIIETGTKSYDLDLVF